MHDAPSTDTPAPYYSAADVTLYQGDSLEVLRGLPDQSVDCCVTSPPYLGLRDYGVPQTVWPEVTYTPMPGIPEFTVPAMTCVLGMEPNPNAFVAHLLLIFREVLRVLADDGTLWLNIGDCYATTPPGPRGNSSTLNGTKFLGSQIGGAAADVPLKSLMGIPWRLQLALLGEGRLLRQEVIWSKSSHMPEAVKDRPTRSHEQVRSLGHQEYLATTPFPDAHFAVMPRTLACAVCSGSESSGLAGSGVNAQWTRHGQPVRRRPWRIARCGQPGNVNSAEKCVRAGCRPGGTVLDPFSGSGTTGAMATKHGRKYVGIDLDRGALDLSLRTRFAQPGLDLTGGVA